MHHETKVKAGGKPLKPKQDDELPDEAQDEEKKEDEAQD